MNDRKVPTLNRTDPRHPGTASALTAALLATFATASAQAVPIKVDIPDVVLNPGPAGPVPTGNSYDLVVGGVTQFHFEGTRQIFIPPDGEIIEGSTPSQVGETFSVSVTPTPLTNNAVVGFRVLPPIEPLSTPLAETPTETKPGTYAKALAANETIDATRFVENITETAKMAGGFEEFLLNGATPEQTDTKGEFVNTGGLKYVGLRFDLTDGTHFGWAEANGVDGTVTLTAYGFECLPNTAIGAGVGSTTAICGVPTVVPEPGTLALLIAGAVGVLSMRRRQRAA